MRPKTKKLSIKEMKKLAKSRGGKCLSTKYVNNQTKLKWQCKEGHVWEAISANVKCKGQWCPVCSGNKKLDIHDMRKLANSKGGKCLSKNYINARTKLKWKCKEGHIWEAVPYSIKIGGWCPVCYRIRLNLPRTLSIEKMRELANHKGGKCLSEKYVNSMTKIKWQCKEGHVWETKPSHIKRGQWCPVCNGTNQLNIEEMKKIAENKGGKCLSKKYDNAHTKLRWRCKEGHVWGATPSNVKYNNRWCPICSTNISERICRKYFEIIFKEKFLKIKPKWLIT